LTDENRNRLTFAALLLSASVVLSRLLGYARDAIIAGMLGASSETDAYYAAFGLPDLMLYFLAGGALSIAFVPLFTRTIEEDREEDGWRLYSNIATTGGILLIVALSIAWVFATPMLSILLPEFSEAQLARTTELTRIILPGPFFFFIGGLTLATEMARKRFLAAALAPLIYNLCIIVGGVLLAERMGAEGFSWGVLAGSILGPFGTSLLFARKSIQYRPVVDVASKALHRYVVVALPLMIGVSLTTIDEWFGRYFASGMTDGSITWLNNARRLMLVPIALVGQAIGQAALPFLSELAARGERKKLQEQLGGTVQATIVLSIACAIGLALIAEPTTRLVYGHGAYTETDVLRTATLLVFFCTAVPGWSVQAVVMRGFYAQEDTIRPMIATTIVAALSFPLYQALANEYGVTGLAVACGIGLTIQAVVAFVLLRVAHHLSLFSHLGRGLALGVGASVPGLLGVLAFQRFLDTGFHSIGDALLTITWQGLLFGLPALFVILRYGGKSSAAIVNRLPARLQRLVGNNG
jgi:putative peptidoglycan lipid II flippase